MTLRMQLTLTVALLFLLTFVGMSVISVDNARRYLAEQLASHAQDTATSLGLSLSPPMKRNDLPTMTSMVDAIFDRGYYREITVRSIHGKMLIRRNLPVKVEGVPAWFVNLVSIETPEEEALVMSGWRQAAVVQVRSHPGYAYRQLWRNSMDELAWFSALASITLVLGSIAMHFMLRALHAVEKQADAISARDYLIQEKLPWTKDLRQVVEVMNRMSSKVRQSFEEQQKLAEMLRAESYLDPVTGIGNRRHFDVQLANLIHSHEEFHSGAIFMVALAGFGDYNGKAGFEAGDVLLCNVAGGLRAIAEDMKGAVLARFRGATFVLLVPNVGLGEIESIADQLIEKLGPLIPRDQQWKEGALHVGIASFEKGMSASSLLSEADMALRSAQSRGPLGWNRFEGRLAAEEVRGAGFWREFLEKAVGAEDIRLQFQKVIGQEGMVHHEVLLRMSHEGELLNAGIFMPMAEGLGYAGRLDRLVISRTLEILRRYKNEKFAINLSAISVSEADFVGWLEERLAGIGRDAARLSFEFSEYDVARHETGIGEMLARISRFGCGFGVDHCGRGFASFGYLAFLKIDYLKIDGSYVRNIDRDRGNQFLVQAISSIAHGLDIRVIAEAVETEAERDILPKLYVDGLQGYLIGKPSSLD